GILDAPVLIDTNIVIDGHLDEVCATGFLSSSIVVPRFVIEELQRLGDSAEPLKRERGRRGLENLAALQKTPQLSLTIHEAEPDLDVPVDTKLVQLAKLIQSRLLTNDANLCKIARLQGVQALNLNELANTVRSSLSTGDEIELVLSKEGRDSHQAVGYLSDGTMIVVNHGRPLIGRNVTVIIAGTLQTSAGRMFFAELKS
ncbi:MAG: PIN domain-containing protein, partial [Verrucomicrobiota bacterium]